MITPCWRKVNLQSTIRMSSIAAGWVTAKSACEESR